MKIEVTRTGELYDKLKELKHLDRSQLQLVKTEEGIFIQSLQPGEEATGLLFSRYDDRELVMAFSRFKEEQSAK